jgi:hypothetical protein
LSSGTTAAVSSFKVVALTSFEASRSQVTASGTIKSIGKLSGLAVGMTVTGDGFPASTTITAIGSDGTITSNAVSPDVSFTAHRGGFQRHHLVLRAQRLGSERWGQGMAVRPHGRRFPAGNDTLPLTTIA